jgi:transposase
LVPLPLTGEVPALLERLLKRVWSKEQLLDLIYASSDEADEGTEIPKQKLLGLGYETVGPQKAEVDGSSVIWEERLLVVYSPAHARRARRGLAQRLERAEQALQALTPPRARGRSQWDDLGALQTEVQAILKRRRVEGLLEGSYIREMQRRCIRKYRDRPTRTEERERYQVQRNSAAIGEARRLMGWRLYAITVPKVQVPLTTSVQVYRDAPRIERDFRRLKGHPLGLRPHVCATGRPRPRDGAPALVGFASVDLGGVCGTRATAGSGRDVGGAVCRQPLATDGSADN